MATLRDFSPKDFIDDLQAINWNNICNHTFLNQSISRFYKCVNQKINTALRSTANRKQNSSLNRG